MFENILKQEYKSLDYRTRIKKQEKNYIAKIAKEYFRPAVRIFGKGKENRLDLEMAVFNGIEEAIKRTERNYSILRGFRRGIDVSPPARLGWAYNKKPTELGFKIVDGLRKISGNSPLKESGEKARKSLWNAGVNFNKRNV
jgi:hypothetical protein